MAIVIRIKIACIRLALCGFTTLLPVLAQEPSEATQNSTQISAANSQNAQASQDQTMGLRPEPPSSISHELTFHERMGIYRSSVLSITTFASPALGAGIDQWQDDPTEWGQGMAGYGRRFGSALGRNLANKTLIFGVSALDKEDPRYFASESDGFASRTKHAAVSAFVSYKEDGSRMPAYAHFAGAYGSSFLAMTWYPPSQSTAHHALVQGTTKLAMNAGMNVLREFWPDIKRHLHFGK